MDYYMSATIFIALVSLAMVLMMVAQDLIARHFRRNAEEEPTSVLRTVANTLRESCWMLLIAALIAACFLALRPSIVIGPSMDSTLYDGQLLCAKRADPKSGTIRRGDIVTLRVDSKVLVKRVVGVPGDIVVIKDGTLFVNGTRIQEDYIAEPMAPTAQAHAWMLSEGRYFVLGDNRNNSRDSRSFGSVHQEDILSVVQVGIGVQGMTVFSPPEALDSVVYRNLY